MQSLFSVMSSNQINSEIPKKRLVVYGELGITRNEGRCLCKLLGYGVLKPLNAQQVGALSRLTKSFKAWKKNGHGLQRFIENYAKEINQ